MFSRCAVYYIPRCFGYEATSRIEGPGHSLGMYSLDLQVIYDYMATFRFIVL